MNRAQARCGKVVVFFSRGMSFDGWSRAGILDRELALYRELQPDVQQFAFVTYGGAAEHEFASLLPGIEILPNRWGIGANLYSLLSPWLHRRSLRGASVFRTNQINGAWSGVIAKRLFGRTLVVRGGFLWADFVERLSQNPWRRRITRSIERFVMRSADRIVVAAAADAQSIVERYQIDVARIAVVPNYVDTCLFKPMPELMVEPGRIAFVGRLDEQKNVGSLLEAIRGLSGVSLTIVGDGPLRPALESQARADGSNVTFVGTLPHKDLPALLNQSEMFVLPSHYEGSPKAIVEAMACGVPVVGRRVPGTRELLIDGDNGRVCGAAPAELRAAIIELHGDAMLRRRLGDGGLAYVRQRCSLAVAVARERELLASLA